MDGTITPTVADALRARFGVRARFDEPLRRHTSFRIGGPADVWIEVETAAEIGAAQEIAGAAKLPFLVFGGGTNVLVSDAGIRGVVISLGRPFAALTWTEAADVTRVRAGAAARFKRLVTEAAARGLSGLEFAEGIPGSIGGGLLMNAGAFGGEIANVIEGVHGVATNAGEQYLPRAALRFGYRFFDLPAGFVVTQLDFILRPDAAAAIRDRIADAKRRREAHQPLGFPNAGSVFKNPPGTYAGRLIESAGLKGRRVGGAMVSEQHANFIVNTGAATAAEVKRLMDEIAECVWQQSAVRLVPEIKLLGEWEEGRCRS
jgi:UDP-N-acetylmuramate dehydrogenase